MRRTAKEEGGKGRATEEPKEENKGKQRKKGNKKAERERKAQNQQTKEEPAQLQQGECGAAPGSEQRLNTGSKELGTKLTEEESKRKLEKAT